MLKCVDGVYMEMTPEEIQELHEANAAFNAQQQAKMPEVAKQQAKQLLVDTDWSQLPDVAETLLNKAEFDAYRAVVRKILLAPVAEPVWPDKPLAQWAT